MNWIFAYDNLDQNIYECRSSVLFYTLHASVFREMSPIIFIFRLGSFCENILDIIMNQMIKG